MPVRRKTYDRVRKELNAERALNLEVAERAVTELLSAYPWVESELVRHGLTADIVKADIHRWVAEMPAKGFISAVYTNSARPSDSVSRP